jgi:four helix bundle protein
MKDYKKLKVWEKSIELVLDIYKLTSGFPKSEQYGLTSQIRRCAVSIPINIAEGSGRESEGDFNHFLNISKGSSNELETQLIISSRLGFLNNENFTSCISVIEEIQKMLAGLQRSLKAKC